MTRFEASYDSPPISFNRDEKHGGTDFILNSFHPEFFDRVQPAIKSTIDYFNARFNSENPDEFQREFKRLKDSIVVDEKTGIRYAAITSSRADWEARTGITKKDMAVETQVIPNLEPIQTELDKDVSKTDASVCVTEIFNGLTAEKMFEKLFEVEMLKEAGITGEDDKPLSAIILSSPIAGDKPKIDGLGLKQIKNGDAKPLTNLYLDVVQGLGFKTISLNGFSLGHTLVAEMATEAPARGLEVLCVTGAGASDTVRRSRGRLIFDVLSQLPAYGPAAKRSTVEAFPMAQAEKGQPTALKAMGNLALHWALIKGILSRPSGLVNNLKTALGTNPNAWAGIAGGESDPVMPARVGKMASLAIREALVAEGKNPDRVLNFTFVKENHGLYSNFSAYSVSLLETMLRANLARTNRKIFEA